MTLREPSQEEMLADPRPHVVEVQGGGRRVTVFCANGAQAAGVILLAGALDMGGRWRVVEGVGQQFGEVRR